MGNTVIGPRILERRKELGLTLDDIAGEIGVSKSTISRYESGTIEVLKLPVIEAIARVLRVSPSWLIGKSEDRTESVPVTVSDDDIKFALFGGGEEITDEMYEEVKRFASYVRTREKERKAGGDD